MPRLTPALLVSLVLVAAAVGVRLAGARDTASHRTALGAPVAAGRRAGSRLPAQATPTRPDLPDLEVSYRWDHWWDECITQSQPWVLTVWVTNRGARGAGPFVVQDEDAIWRIAALGAGDTWYREEWAKYPGFPIVADAYNQVAEADEWNNVVGPPTGPTIVDPLVGTPVGPTSPNRNDPSRALPREPLVPAAVMTLPVFCTPRSPAPTLTPSGDPPLPDLVVSDVRWEPVTIQQPGGAAACEPGDQPWHAVVTIENHGRAPAVWFSVGAPPSGWRVRGLGAGQSLTFASEPRALPASVVVDVDGEVQESNEDNNTWTAPDTTPTPAGQALPTCAITPSPTAPTATPTATVPTRTPRPLTPTPTGTSTPTPSAPPSPRPALLPALKSQAR